MGGHSCQITQINKERGTLRRLGIMPTFTADVLAQYQNHNRHIDVWVDHTRRLPPVSPERPEAGTSQADRDGGARVSR
jgi:hypothetical protein